MPALTKEQKKFLDDAASKYAANLGDAEAWLGARGIDLDHARYEGLGVVEGDVSALHDQYRGRLSIPYITDFGVVNMTFRCLQAHSCKDEGHGKYLKTKGAESDLYGVRSFDDATDWIGVCEGELDSFILRQIGIPAVSVPGAKVWKEHWVNVFEDLSRVYVFSDADDAGDEMYKKLQDRLHMPVIKVRLPKGEDVNSTFMKYGAQAILDRIKK